MQAPLVLASRSPQRSAILAQLGVEFHVSAPDVEEMTGGDPRTVVTENALRKASAVAVGLEPGRPVLGVDTAVVLEGRTYGKPRGRREAREWLERLSGRRHQVWSGITLVASGDQAARRRRAEPEEASGGRMGAAVTEVRFRPLSGRDIDWYVDSGEWRERAGGYAIQGRGAALVEWIQGDYWNVVGLPVAELMRLAPEVVLGGSRSSVR